MHEVVVKVLEKKRSVNCWTSVVGRSPLARRGVEVELAFLTNNNTQQPRHKLQQITRASAQEHVPGVFAALLATNHQDQGRSPRGHRIEETERQEGKQEGKQERGRKAGPQRPPQLSLFQHRSCSHQGTRPSLDGKGKER